MAADENLFRRSILDVVGEVQVLRDLQASMTERALFRLDWLLDVGKIIMTNQTRLLLVEIRRIIMTFKTICSYEYVFQRSPFSVRK